VIGRSLSSNQSNQAG